MRLHNLINTESQINLYITTTRRNLILSVLKESQILFKMTLGNLQIKSQDRKAPFASKKLAYIFGYKLLKKNIFLINLYINSWNKVYKKIILILTKLGIIIKKLIFIKFPVFNGTKIRNARRK